MVDESECIHVIRSKLEMIRILAGQSTSMFCSEGEFILFVGLFTDLSFMFFNPTPLLNILNTFSLCIEGLTKNYGG